jgi:hypothetical protein
MSEDWTADIPLKMQNLPLDHRRKVPIPRMNLTPDGVDFTTINNETVIECGRDRLCGICGNALSYWIAFVGGPISASTGAYTDPPFHVECAEAAFRFCPHIARKVHRRTPDDRMPEGSWKSVGAVEEKPERWIIGITRDYKMIPWGRGVLFKCNVRHRRIYEYDETGNLQELK